MNWMIRGSVLVLLLLFPVAAQAGLYEKVTDEEGVSYYPRMFGEAFTNTPVSKQLNPPKKETPETGEPVTEDVQVTEKKKEKGPLWKIFTNKPKKAKFFDPRIEPVLFVRGSYVHTFEDVISHTNNDGTAFNVDSSKMDPSQFGHRVGFVLENVELGLAGRFNGSGIYYKAKFELVPREKDGNRSSDYLKDAYLGWNLFSIFDLRIGRMKVNFSQANMKSTEDRPLVFSPVLDTLIPKRQLGIMAELSDPWKIIRGRAGLYNSVKLASEQITDADQLMRVFRLDLNISNLLKLFNVNPYDLDLNVGASYAYVKENFDPKTEHRWQGIDARLHLLLVTIEGEYVVKDHYGTPDINGAQQSYRGEGYHIDVTIHAWPEVIDLAFRYEFMDGNDLKEDGFNTIMAIDDLVPQKKRWITGGLTFHATDEASISVNFIHRKELEGFDFDNDVIIATTQISL